MMSTPDQFSASFDSIEVSAASPSKEAIERAMAHIAPRDELLTTTAAAPDLAQPGFYLLDDAGGRFTVDREFGVVSLKSEALLSYEQGSVHPVRLRVVEGSGESYELNMQLRISGLIPQMVGSEDNDFFGLSTAPAAPELKPRAVSIIVTPEPAATPVATHTAPVNVTPWHQYSAAHATHGKGEIVRPRRSLIVPAFPTTGAFTHVMLNIGTPLPATGSTAPWSL